jgi:hypothetical protein
MPDHNRASKLRLSWTAAIAVVCMVTACADKARPEYARCLRLESDGDLPGAASACASAVKASPLSFSGKSATKHLTAIGDKRAKATAIEEERAARKVVDDAAEQKQLLASASPDDWRTLVAKHPNTPAAAVASSRLSRAASLCADRDSWPLDAWIARASNLGTDFASARDAARATGDASFSAVTSLGAQARREALSARDLASKVAAHASLPGEGSVRDSLIDDLHSIATLDDKWDARAGAYAVDRSSFAALVKETSAFAGRLALADVNRARTCAAILPKSAGAVDATTMP